MTNLDSVLKSRNITLLPKVYIVKTMVFPIVMYRCESWTIKKAEHWRTDAFELWCWRRLKTLESPLDCKEIKPSNPKGNQSWIFVGRTDAEDEAPILWPPHAKNWLTGEDPAAGKDEGRRRRGWQRMRRLDGMNNSMHMFEKTPGDSEGEESLVCCSPMGLQELDTTEQVNNNNIKL